MAERSPTLPRDARELAARGYEAAVEVARALGATGEVVERAERALEKAAQREVDSLVALREAHGALQQAQEMLRTHEARMRASPMPAPTPAQAAPATPAGERAPSPLVAAAARALDSGHVRLAILVACLAFLALSVAALVALGVDPDRVLELLRWSTP